MRTLAPSLAILAITLFPDLASGQCEVLKLGSPHPEVNGTFGSDLQVQGTTAVIGGRNASNRRTAFVYEWAGTSWTLSQELVGLPPGTAYPTPVALDGNTIMLGHPDQNLVFVFGRSGGVWSQVQVLAPAGPVKDPYFGLGIVIDGDRAIITAPTNSVLAYRAGTVFVFERSAGIWTQTARIEPPSLEYAGWFGYSADIQGDLVLIGEAGYGPPANVSRAYTYRHVQGAWKFDHRFIGPYGAGFGWAVALDGETIAIGAYKDTTHGGPWRGSVRIYENIAGWQEVAMITASLPEADHDFGARLELKGRHLAVGSFLPVGTQGTQPVHVYERTQLGWEFLSLLQHHGEGPYPWGPFFGDSLSMDGDTLWIGSPGDMSESGFTWSGAAYAYTMETLAIPYCGPANTNSRGLSAEIRTEGCPTLASNNLVLRATNLAFNSATLFLAARHEDFIPFVSGSQGNLCLGGRIGQYARQAGNSGPAGEVTLEVDLTAIPIPGGYHSGSPGETWFFQCWYRDVNPGRTSNFTDAVQVMLR